MRKRSKLQSQMNVIPFIDIMLVLLVAFIITTPLMYPHLNVQLPHGQPTQHQRATLTVSIDRQHHMYLKLPQQRRHRLSLSGIRQRLQRYWHRHPNAEKKVWIAADQRLRYQTVMQTIETTRKAGAKAIGLISDPT